MGSLDPCDSEKDRCVYVCACGGEGGGEVGRWEQGLNIQNKASLANLVSGLK